MIELDLKVYYFTKAGKEILRLIDPIPNKEYLECLKQNLQMGFVKDVKIKVIELNKEQ